MKSKKRAVSDVTKRTSCLVVGVGASAGGLEAFAQLLTALDVQTGMAYVLIQHLDPNHESMLSELLAKSTTMPVMVVQDGVEPMANHIYVIPQNATMAFQDGRLQLTARTTGEDRLHPIDQFFSSLALEQKEHAIGVILSGTGNDGAKGLADIAAMGGVTFAQDKKTAKFPSMPTAAIDGGVDFVLSPEGIADELAKISANSGHKLNLIDEKSQGFLQILQMLLAAV